MGTTLLLKLCKKFSCAFIPNSRSSRRTMGCTFLRSAYRCMWVLVNTFEEHFVFRVDSTCVFKHRDCAERTTEHARPTDSFQAFALSARQAFFSGLVSFCGVQVRSIVNHKHAWIDC